jgi:hypothetical protein
MAATEVLSAENLWNAFYKDDLLNCSLKTDQNAQDSVFVYQCGTASAEDKNLRDQITAVHLMTLLFLFISSVRGVQLCNCLRSPRCRCCARS